MRLRFAALAGLVFSLSGSSCPDRKAPGDQAVNLSPPDRARFGKPEPPQAAPSVTNEPRQPAPAAAVQPERATFAQRWPEPPGPPPVKDQSRLPAPDEPPARAPFDPDAARLLAQARALPAPPQPQPRVEEQPVTGKCRPVPNVGCLIEKPGADRILIYMRGHLTRQLPNGPVKNKKDLPPDRLAESAADAVEQYGLRDAAAGLNASLLVTGSSHVSIDVAQLRAAGLKIPGKIVVAAHSGAYFGLSNSLPNLPALEGVVLLDPFFGQMGPIATALRKRLAAGNMKCGGFFTPLVRNKKGKVISNTKASYNGTFAPAMGPDIKRCPSIEAPSHSAGHAEHILRVMR